MNVRVSFDTAAILVGGMGTRLRSVVADRPKSLALIGDRPFICILLDQLAACGVRRVILCTGYKAAMLEDALGNNYCGISILYSHESEPLGTAGAIRLAAKHIESNVAFVMNGDSYCAADLSEFSDFHIKKDARVSILLTKVPDVSRFGAVELSSDGTILDFCEKGHKSDRGLINAGIYVLNRKTIQEIPENRSCSLEKDVFPNLIGHGLYGWPGGGKFIDIGIPDDFERAQTFLDKERRSLA